MPRPATRSRRRRQADVRAGRRADRDVAPRRRLVGHGGGELVGAQDASEHDAHLQHREAHPDAAAPSAAERDPGVGAGLRVEEALRPEGVGVRVDVRVVVEQVGVGDEGAGPRLVVPAADRDRLGDEARLAVGEDRAAAQRFPDRREEVVLRSVVRAHLLGQPPEHLRLAAESLERPGQGRRGGLVPGDQQSHQLVAELLRSHLGAVLVAGLQQHREDIVAAALPLRPAFRDQLRDQLVGAVPVGQHSLERAEAVEPAHRSLHRLGVVGSRDQAQRAVAVGEEAGEAPADGVEAGARVEAEDRAKNDLER